MTYNELQALKIEATKTGDKTRIKVLNDIIVLVQKEQTKGKVKVDATEEMVAAAATKVQKMLEEMVATCPGKTAQKDYTPLLEEYQAQLAIAREYAPQLVTDRTEIQCMILSALEEGDLIVPLTKKNKGQIMRVVAPALKGKADMTLVNQTIEEMLV